MKLVELKEVVDSIEYGYTASACPEKIGPHFLRITDIQDNHVNWARVPYCDCPKNGASRYRLQAGDLVFARTGATTGKSYLIEDLPEEAVFASYLIRVRPSAVTDPKFLSYFFKSSHYWHQINENATGAIQPSVNGTKLSRLKIPLLSNEKQKEIVRVLSAVEAAIDKRREAIGLLDDFLKSTFLDMFGNARSNSKKLTVRKLIDVARVIGGGTPSKNCPAYWRGIIPWVSPKDMGGEEILDTEDHITDLAVNKSATCLVPKNAVLIVFRSGILAHSVPIALAGREVALNQDMKALIPKNKEMMPLYLYGFLNASTEALLQCVKRGATVQSMDSERFRSFPILVPPLKQQLKYVDISENCRNLKQKMKSSEFELQNLLNALMQKAFKGELA